MGIFEVALYVNHLEKSKTFYEKYFNAVASEKNITEEGDIESYTLTFDEGIRIRLISRPEIITSKKFLYDSGYRYITIKLGSKENMDQTIYMLRKDGYRILKKHTLSEAGNYEVIVLDTENNQIVMVE